MKRFDWGGLLRIGVTVLGLRPQEFWSLTPAEFRLMLGHDLGRPPLSRNDITALETLFSDFN